MNNFLNSKTDLLGITGVIDIRINVNISQEQILIAKGVS